MKGERRATMSVDDAATLVARPFDLELDHGVTLTSVTVEAKRFKI